MPTDEVPPGLNSDDSYQSAIVASLTVTWLFLLLAFGARLYCRRIIKMPAQLDDWLVIPAVLFATFESLVTIAYMVPNNLGKHIYVIPSKDREQKLLHLRIGIFIFQQSWSFGIISVKASILAFYWRVFAQNTAVKYQIILWSTIISCWFVEYFIIKLTYCTPIRGLWDDTVDTKCTVDVNQVLFINGVINTISDAGLIIVPLPAIWSLRLKSRQKLALTGIFLIGMLCTAASITRLVYMKKDFHLTTSIEDVSWNLMWTTTWTALELNMGVICACLPQLRPLLFPHRRATAHPPPTSFMPSSTHGNSTMRTFGSMPTQQLQRPGDSYLELGSIAEITSDGDKKQVDDEENLVQKRDLGSNGEVDVNAMH